MLWWIYESWTHERAILHRASCSYCQNGRGRQSSASGKNGHWIGPFSDLAEAKRHAAKLHRATTDVCSRCRSDRGGRVSESLAQKRAKSGMAEKSAMFEDQAKTGDAFARLHGCMKGTIKFASGFDPCAPVWTEEDEKEFDEKWDRRMRADDRKAEA